MSEPMSEERLLEIEGSDYDHDGYSTSCTNETGKQHVDELCAEIRRVRGMPPAEERISMSEWLKENSPNLAMTVEQAREEAKGRTNFIQEFIKLPEKECE